MKLEIIKSYFENFNKYVYEADGLEFWFARDIQTLLGYSSWQNFMKVIEKAKEACKNSGVIVEDNFANTVRAVNMPNGGIKEMDDMFLTRYACYLIAQNGDPAKEQIAFAMSYFAIQTRKQEIIEKRISDFACLINSTIKFNRMMVRASFNKLDLNFFARRQVSINFHNFGKFRANTCPPC